jgi:hypothetical protein
MRFGRGPLGLCAVMGVGVLALLISGGGAAVASGGSTADVHAVASCRCGGARVVKQVNLNPPRGRGKAKGIAEIIRLGNSAEIAIVAAGLRPNSKQTAYAVWLYNSLSDTRLLGFVSPPLRRGHHLQTSGTLPRGWRRFRRLVISLEKSSTPTRPHHIALIGRLTRRRGFTG